MKLPELVTLYEERARIAAEMGSQADVARVYRVVIDELAKLDGIEMVGRWFDSAEAAELLGVSPKTVRRWCRSKRFRHARLTSGDRGEWRIPARDVYAETGQKNTTGAGSTVPKLWEANDG